MDILLQHFGSERVISIAFFIELRLRGSHSLRSLVNYYYFYYSFLIINYSCFTPHSRSSIVPPQYFSSSYSTVYYKCSTLPCGISINIAHNKVGYFPRPNAEINIYYRGCNVWMFHKEGLNIYLITWANFTSQLC